MIRHRLLGSLVALAILPSAAAVAQGSGSEAEQEACTPDVFRLCQDFIPNEAPIVACLKVNRAKLSPACYRVFYSDASAATPTVHHHRHKHRHHAD